MAIALVQTKNQNAGNYSNTNVLTFASNTVTGNALIMSVTMGNADSIASITDSQGNTWSLAVAKGSSGQRKTSIYYAPNITGGSTVVTITFGAAQYPDSVVIAREYSGLSASPLDQTGSGSQVDGEEYAHPNISTTGSITQANELVVMAVGGNNRRTWTAGTGYGNIVNQYGFDLYTGGASQDKAVSSTGVQTGTMTADNIIFWDAVIATFKEAASSTPVTVSPAVQSIVASIAAVAVITSQILSPAPVSASLNTPAPSVQLAANGVPPIGLLLALTKSGSDTNISPSPQTAIFSIQSPNVSTSQNLSIGVQSATFSVQNPTAYSPVSVFPATQNLTFSIQQPVVAVIQSTTVAVPVQSATFSTPAVTVVQNQLTAPAVQSSTFSIPAVNVIVQTNSLVQANALNGVFSIPIVTVRTSQIIQPAVQSAVFSIPASAVSVSYTNAPAVQSVIFTTNAVSFITHNRLSIAVQILTFSIPTPNRTGGFYSNKYSSQNTNYGDKYTARNTTYSNKHSARNTPYSDKYTKLNL